MSQLSQNLEKIIQMISIEQLLGLVKQNTDNKSNSDIMNLPIVQKVVKAYEDEIQTLHTPPSSSSSLEKDYSGDIAKINEQLASINNNLLQLTEAIRNINVTTKDVKREELVLENVLLENVVVVASLEEEHVRLKIEEKQELEVISKAESELEEEESEQDDILSVAEELSVAEIEEEEVEETEELEEEESEDTEIVEDEETEEESEKEISDEESIASLEEEVASLEEEVASLEEEVASLEEDISETEAAVAEKVASLEEEEEVFEIEIDDVTYYATSEENGILYEVDADGEVGKKVGIIKDGEPIFI
jgi:chromosome segregation ATPase